MHFIVRFAPLTLAVFLTGCGGGSGGPDPAPPVFQTMAKSIDNIQCQPVMNTYASVDAQLALAGITPRSKSCAREDNTVASVCGAPTTIVFRVVEISSDQVTRARELGFKALGEFTNVVPLDCPAQ